jgi:hypothetical protein
MNVVGNLKETLAVNVKNIVGWKTKRKIVVFSVDDYGNVQLDSREARDKLFANGLKTITRFDQYDALETPEDLTALYETLTAVKDKFDRPAVFTAYSVCANIDFERMRETGFSTYYYEELPRTFDKLKGYHGAWELWQEGMQHRLLSPQFHGREHLNVKVLMEGLQKKNPVVQSCFDNRSYTAIADTGYRTIDFSAALDFYHFSENEELKKIAADGLDLFEKVFGFRATNFTPCGSNGYSTSLDSVLLAGGIKYIDTSRFKADHMGEGKFEKKVFYYTGKKNALGQSYLVRNCVFEPTDQRGIEWVPFCLKQIEAAFRWNMPANISSHRVNFCGRIDPANRKAGLKSLRELLNAIVKRWPDVEFMTSGELGNLITTGEG